MNVQTVSVINQSHHPLPEYKTSGSAGMDLQAFLPDGAQTLSPMERALIPTGLFIALPDGLEAQIRPRSGTAFKKGLTLINSPGTIDSDYRGEIMIPIINLSTESQTIADGERIAQMVVAPFVQARWNQVRELDATIRAEGGFGHTGTH